MANSNVSILAKSPDMEHIYHIDDFIYKIMVNE